MPAGVPSRRRFIARGLMLTGLGLLIGCSALTPLAPTPTPRRASRVAVLGWSDVPSSDAGLASVQHLRQGLRESGRDPADVEIQGQYVLEPERYAAGATELLRHQPEVFVAATTAAALAIRQAAPATPIVVVNSADPVGSGLVESLSRPGGTVTGLSTASSQVTGKRLQLLKDVRPEIRRVAIIRNPDSPDTALELAEARAAAATLGLRLIELDVRSAQDIDGVLGSVQTEKIEGIIILYDTVTIVNRSRLLGHAVAHRLPTVVDRRTQFLQAGGLMSYGPDPNDLWRRAGRYVDKILDGARTADLPVEQPTTFELVISQHSADMIGITIPPSVLLQATEVIQ